MAKTGHEQLLNMAGEGRGKVDKSIQPPKGFGVVDYVFYRFQQRWKDEWRRRMVSQAGCEAIAGEWQASLRLHAERDIRQAVDVCLDNSIPPSLAGFVSVVEQTVADRKPVKRDRAFGRDQLNNIKSLFGDKGGEVTH